MPDFSSPIESNQIEFPAIRFVRVKDCQEMGLFFPVCPVLGIVIDRLRSVEPCNI